MESHLQRKKVFNHQENIIIGLDPEERLRFKSVLTQLHGSCPIILSTHIVEDIESVCQSVLVLKKGLIVFDGNLEQLKNEAKNKVYEMTLQEY